MTHVPHSTANVHSAIMYVIYSTEHFANHVLQEGEFGVVYRAQLAETLGIGVQFTFKRIVAVKTLKGKPV